MRWVKTIRSAVLLAVAALVAGVVPAVPLAAQTAPVMPLDLGTLGGDESHATDINNRGQVVGASWTTDGRERAFLWTSSEGMVDLGTLGGSSSSAVAISNSGQVVGWSHTADGESHAFSWTAEGGMVDLGTLGGAHSEAVAVNDSGQVVGWSDTADSVGHPFSWTEAEGMTDLGSIGDAGYATAVNNNGQVVGYFYLPPFDDANAFFWSESSGMLDLGTLGGGADASAISDRGEVVGSSGTADGSRRAFLWTVSGGMVDLGRGWAVDVNNRGEVVGGGGGGWLWTASGGRVDLGTTRDFDVAEPRAISERGHVVGQLSWIDYSGSERGFVWTSRTGMVELGTVGDGQVSGAVEVNALGQVVGSSHTRQWEDDYETGNRHAVLWNTDPDAVPPPPPAACTIRGTSGDDVLVGTAGDDVVCGLGGNDRLLGLVGDDLLLGGPGRDMIRGGPGGDELRGGLGRDFLRGGPGADVVYGDDGHDRLFGHHGDDYLHGSRGDDFHHGGQGTDICNGAADVDRSVQCEQRLNLEDFADRGCAGIHASLVSRWSGEGDARDSVGGQHGSVVGDVAFTQGVVGRAFHLAGAGYIEVPDSDKLDLTEAYTLSGWLKYDDISSFLGVIAKRPDAGDSFTNYGINVQQHFGLGAYYDDPAFSGVGDDANEFEVVRVEPPSPGTLFHFAVTVRQRTNETVLIRLFIDGRIAASRQMPGRLSRSVNDVPLTIGASSPSGGEPFVGLLDEVSIYNRALSAGQLRGLVDAQASGRRC